MAVPRVVMDSGVRLSLLLGESLKDNASALTQYWLKEGFEIHAPSLFQYEIVAVMRKSVVRERITDNDAKGYIKTALLYPIIYSLDTFLHQRAYDLSTQFKRPIAYDSQYLALAERLDCEFWTADKRLFNAVKGDFPLIRWVGNFTIPETTIP